MVVGEFPPPSSALLLCKLVIFVAVEKFSINDILKLWLNIIVSFKYLSNEKIRSLMLSYDKRLL